MQLVGRYIDGYPDTLRPFGSGFTGLTNNPFAQTDNQTGVLGDVDKIIRINQTLGGMIPAYQRFVAIYAFIFQIDDWLVMKLEFLVINTIDDFLINKQAVGMLHHHAVFEEMEATPTMMF